PMACERNGPRRRDRAMPARRLPVFQKPRRYRRAGFRTMRVRGLCVVRCPPRSSASVLRPEVRAAFAATGTMHADAGDLTRGLNPLPDETREVLKRRQAKAGDVVEQLVVELLLHIGDTAFEQS